MLGSRPRICKISEITRTIYSKSERSADVSAIFDRMFSNLVQEVSISKLEQGEFKLVKIIGIYKPTVKVSMEKKTLLLTRYITIKD